MAKNAPEIRPAAGPGTATGTGAAAGNGAATGTGATKGTGATTGTDATTGNGATMGTGATTGNGAATGTGAEPGSGTDFGSGAGMGPGARPRNDRGLGAAPVPDGRTDRPDGRAGRATRRAPSPGALLLSALVALAPGRAAPAQEGPRVSSAPAAMLRALDKITGETTDLEIARGDLERYGRLTIVLGDCRYPTDDPASEAYAWLEIRDPAMTEPAFSGWMLASSPALHAMDHPRYDIWVLRCNSS
jgi:hypothetical protein